MEENCLNTREKTYIILLGYYIRDQTILESYKNAEIKALPTLQSPVVTIGTARFNIQKLYVLPTQCIYVFCADLRTNGDYFTLQQ